MLRIILLNSEEFSRSEFSIHLKLKPLNPEKHHFKLHSKWLQLRARANKRKEMKQKENKTVYKPAAIQTTTT